MIAKTRTNIAAGVARAMHLFGGSFVRDACVIGGAASIAYGAYLVAPAAGYIVGGCLLIAGAVAQELMGPQS